MACLEYHIIYCPGIKTKLIEGGFVSERTLHPRKSGPGKIYPNVLDYSKCNPAEWAKQLQHVLEAGVVDFAERNRDGSYGVRRDFTAAEQAELSLYPVHFPDDDHVEWYSKWKFNEDPLIYISTALPIEMMHFSAFYEDSFDGSWYVRNGKHFCDTPTILLRPGEYERAVNDVVIALQNNFLVDLVPYMKERASKCTTPEEYEGMLVDYVDFYQNHPQPEMTEEDLPF